MNDPEINKLRKLIVELCYESQEGHIASAFSILDILYVLYEKILKISLPDDKLDKINDIFILSKGHACLALYAVLYKKGFFTLNDLKTYCDYDSPFGGHPDKTRIPGVTASTGSLGHGLPIAVGIAMAKKIKKVQSETFVLVGDGELNEGTNWEAILLASHHNLKKLTCIVDHNHSTDRAVMIDNAKDKFISFGWNAKVIDGHDGEQIYSSLTQKPSNNKPIAIIARTIKGKGINKMENNQEWHHKSPNEREYLDFIEELS